MAWLTLLGVILGVGLLVFIVSLLSGEDTEDATENATTAALGCFIVLMQLVVSAIVIWILWSFGNWLFG